MARPPLCQELGSVPMAPPVEYDWDDWDSRAYFHYAEVPELDRLKGLTGHANIALAIAVCEWIEARFRGLGLDRDFSDYLDIAWAALLDRSLTAWIYLDFANWRGPIRKPQLLAMGIINEALFESSDNSEMAWRACYALNLARYVLPEGTAFEEWYVGVRARLEAAHSWTTDGAHVEDLFDSGIWQGHPVAREAFDLARPYDGSQAGALLQSYVQRLDRDNPFLEMPS